MRRMTSGGSPRPLRNRPLQYVPKLKPSLSMPILTARSSRLDARSTRNRIIELHESANQKSTPAHRRAIKLVFKMMDLELNRQASSNGLRRCKT